MKRVATTSHSTLHTPLRVKLAPGGMTRKGSWNTGVCLTWSSMPGAVQVSSATRKQSGVASFAAPHPVVAPAVASYAVTSSAVTPHSVTSPVVVSVGHRHMSSAPHMQQLGFLASKQVAVASNSGTGTGSVVSRGVRGSVGSDDSRAPSSSSQWHRLALERGFGSAPHTEDGKRDDEDGATEGEERDVVDASGIATTTAVRTDAKAANSTESTPDVVPEAESSWMSSYLGRFRGAGESAPPAPPNRMIGMSGFKTALGLGAASMLGVVLGPDYAEYYMLIGPFGASAALIFAAPLLPASQPRAVILGHMLSASIGVAVHTALTEIHGEWIAAPPAAALAVCAMLYTRTFHPPAAATAMMGVLGPAKVHALGWMFPFIPVGLGATVLCAVGVIANNLQEGTQYPRFWW